MRFKGMRKSHIKGKSFSTFVVFAVPDFYRSLTSLELAREGAVLFSNPGSFSVCFFFELINISPLVIKQHTHFFSFFKTYIVLFLKFCILQLLFKMIQGLVTR